MAQGARPAMDIQFAVGDAQLPHGGHRHDREGLVHLEQIHLIHAPCRLLQRLFDGSHGRGGEPAWLLRMGGVFTDDRYGGQPPGLGVGLPRQRQGRRAIGNGAGIGGCHTALFGERGAQLWHFFGVAPARLLIGVHHALALAGVDQDWRDLLLELSFLDGDLRPGQRIDGVSVLRLPGKAVFLRAGLRENAHQLALVVGVFQAVVEHVINHLAMPQAHAAPGLGQ